MRGAAVGRGETWEKQKGSKFIQLRRRNSKNAMITVGSIIDITDNYVNEMMVIIFPLLFQVNIGFTFENTPLVILARTLLLF